MNDPLSTDCPARALARQFIAKFKEDDGAVRSIKKAIFAKDATDAPSAKNFDAIDIALSSARVALDNLWSELGRRVIQKGIIRSKAIDCKIGDAFKGPVDVPPECAFVKIIATPDGAEFALGTQMETFYSSRNKVLIFKKVLYDMIDNGTTWNPEYYWERIE